MQSTLRLMTHQPRDKKSPRRLNKHPIRMTRCRSRCGISQFESFTGDLSSRCASVLTRASRAVSWKWISTCNLAWSLWRWSHSELVGGCWVVTMHALPNLFAARALFCNQYASLSMHLAIRLLGHYRLSRYSSRCLCKSAQGSSLMTIFLPKGRSLIGSLMRRPASSQQFTRPIFGFLAGSSHCISARSVTTNSD